MSLRIELHPDIGAIDPAAWDRLTGDDDPFVEHTFLHALELSGSVGVRAGWQPIHVTAWRGDELCGALPLYAKDDSWGEYIFDFAWARAAAQMGIAYFPKLVSMAPFTPATGKRFLVADGDTEIAEALLAGARAAADRIEASSVHLLFLTPEERDLAARLGFAPRLSMQFHWDNEGYSTFDDYLAGFRSAKRKQLKRERRRIAESDLQIVLKPGVELDDADLRAIKAMYRANCLAHGQHPYLRPEMFDRIRERYAHRLLVGLAYHGGEAVACSINFEKGKHLYGRYWGCHESHEFLHFELCYYRLIERAIERGYTHFEAGAQGFHKLKRGLMPSEVHSAHWIRHPRLARAVESFLPEEAMAMRMEMDELAERSPFHRGPSNDD
ncbi:MAG: GNAT family N-acetyltransferase [Sandaracinaceae bacterium]